MNPPTCPTCGCTEATKGNARQFLMLLDALKSEHNRAQPFGEVLRNLGCSEPSLETPVLMSYTIQGNWRVR